MTKNQIFMEATKAAEKNAKEQANYKSNVKKALKEFHLENPELKGEEFLKAFRDSGKAYAEAWNDDEVFDYAFSL